MTANDVDFFNRIKSQLSELHSEMGLLSKGKPDHPVNSFKLKFINEKIEEANKILIGDFKPLRDFSKFEDDTLPSNSDVVMILSQYLNSLEGWRSAHVELESKGWVWSAEDRTIRAEPPSSFRQA